MFVNTINRDHFNSLIVKVTTKMVEEISDFFSFTQISELIEFHQKKTEWDVIIW